MTPHEHATSTHASENSGLRSILRLVSRRRRIVVGVPIVLLALALGRSFTQEPLYQGTAEVLLSRQNLANTLQGTSTPSYQPAEFFQIARTQATLAHTLTVADRVIR